MPRRIYLNKGYAKFGGRRRGGGGGGGNKVYYGKCANGKYFFMDTVLQKNSPTFYKLNDME